MNILPLLIRWYKATAAGSTRKFVRCKKCGLDYTYLLTRQASGTAWGLRLLNNGPQRAQERANRSLQIELGETDPVPCLSCGELQPEMVSDIRRRYFARLHVWGKWMAMGGAVWLFAMITRTVSSKGSRAEEAAAVAMVLPMFILAIGLGMMFLRLNLQSSYDPNVDEISKLRWSHAAMSACTVAEFNERREGAEKSELEGRSVLEDIAPDPSRSIGPADPDALADLAQAVESRPKHYRQ